MWALALGSFLAARLPFRESLPTIFIASSHREVPKGCHSEEEQLDFRA